MSNSVNRFVLAFCGFLGLIWSSTMCYMVGNKKGFDAGTARGFLVGEAHGHLSARNQLREVAHQHLTRINSSILTRNDGAHGSTQQKEAVTKLMEHCLKVSAEFW